MTSKVAPRVARKWKVKVSIEDSIEEREEFLDEDGVRELFEMCNVPAGVEVKVESVTLMKRPKGQKGE